MNGTIQKYGLLAVKALLTLVFLAAGSAKLIGVQILVDEFAALGLGQWFRYLTALFEIGGAILLWLPGKAAYGAGLLVCTMIGALVAHATVLGMASSPPAMVLLVLAALTLWVNRAQLQRPA